MKTLTAAAKTRITEDWARRLPGLGKYRAMHLLRRVGPLLIGVALERDSTNRSYLPTFHVHNLTHAFPVVTLTLAEPLHTRRTGAPDHIDVRWHETSYPDAVGRLVEQALLPFEGKVTLSDVLRAYRVPFSRPGLWRCNPRLFEDMILICGWAGANDLVQSLLAKAADEMARWPRLAPDRVGDVGEKCETWRLAASDRDALRRTVDSEIKAHKLGAVPVDDLQR